MQRKLIATAESHVTVDVTGKVVTQARLRMLLGVCENKKLDFTASPK